MKNYVKWIWAVFSVASCHRSTYGAMTFVYAYGASVSEKPETYVALAVLHGIACARG